MKRSKSTLAILFFTALAVAFAAAQAVRLEPAPAPLKLMAVHERLAVPGPVQQVLNRACNDCHSTDTRWPWYSRVAPVSWMVTRDVQAGRKAMSIDAWSANNRRRTMGELMAACAVAQAGLMPPKAYTLIHREARLTAADVTTLCEWTAMETKTLSARVSTPPR
ncbi:MAG: heme-binding domain-containing protein [Acidobacteria bacterium]|nr:heme-binding domain-containing protein [Acidobacteriota bacterium]